MTEKNLIKKHLNHYSQTNELSDARIPIILWVTLVYAATIILQTISEPLLIQSLIFTGLISLHATLHWYTHSIVSFRPWLYFLVQGILIFFSAFLMPSGFPAALLGLIPVLIGQSVGIYYQKTKIFFVSLLLYTLFCLAIISVSKLENLALYIPLLLLMMIVVIAYAMLFFQQVRARIRTQTFLRDLELAHKKVEELTLANERQRMARDLHDTLAQGLAGLIMQLEAINIHLSKDNVNRVKEIVTHSMQQARKTLADARGAIDDLRSTSISEINFTESVKEETTRFTAATGIHVSLLMVIKEDMPKMLVEHSLHIVSECLTNVARHAHAQNVWVTIYDKPNKVYIEVKDNGIGFHTDLIGKQSGHYGLIGILERVRLIRGEIKIRSILAEGTLIEIEVPLLKGE
ncbi:sensor histidine kinase [Paenibacillus luteus]|uniref:sensor histidine kinase n=1 Tax=Paenibacillus luteus TaxID=2545753 RepID=UPI001F4F8BF7|nr:sensor histidine kinase [Paenibacillus luteus]